MKIPKVSLTNQVRKIRKKDSFQILEKQISKLQEEALGMVWQIVTNGILTVAKQM